MRPGKENIRPIACAGLVVLSMALFMTGCESAPTPAPEPMGMPQQRSRATGQTKSLEEIRRNILENQKEFASLVAECRIKIRSPLLPERMSGLTFRGELKLLKPRKIHFVIYHGGQMAMRLVGNGKQYKVEQPIFGDTYGGKYDSGITSGQDRLHFMPDDLVDGLDLRSLFYGRPQVLESYPQRWDIAPGSLRSPVQYPPVWVIDSLNISPPPNAQPQIDNSVMVDRRNERIRRIDKFREDGSLRVRIWHLNTIPVRGSEGGSVDLPRNIFLWYPPPLEGTMINIRFEKYKVNVPVEKSTFNLGG